MIANLDGATIEKIKSLGGLKAIVISHPHYYTTYAEWWRVFRCPIFVGADDQEWLCRKPPSSDTFRLIEGPAGSSVQIVPGVTAIKTGGHFPGSLVLHWENKLFIADTIVTVPVSCLDYLNNPYRFSVFLTKRVLLTEPMTQSAYTPHPRPPGQTSYVFEWSIPNMIPLPPDEIFKIWEAIKPFDFDTTHGAFNGMDVRDPELKGRMLESMKIQVRGGGWKEHKLLEQTV